MRTLGKTGLKAYPLGFGTMRLAMRTIGGEAFLDLDQAVDVIRYGFSRGLNYVDTAFFYCGRDSELALGRALSGWRDRVIVTSKAPQDQMKKPGDLRRILEYQLGKLNLEALDFYCFHGVSWENFQTIDRQARWLKDMLKARDEKLVRHIAFSFHGPTGDMKKLIDLGLFEMVTCQYNYLNTVNRENMAYARAQGLAVVVMGPVGGGRLAGLPGFLRKRRTIDTSSAAGLALRFVLSNPDVSVAISGMSTRQMVDENVTAIEAGPFSRQEMQSLNRLLIQHKKLADLYCTGCRYCLPCPKGVNIPGRFEAMNFYRVYGLKDYARRLYQRLKLQDAKNPGGGQCVQCGQCMKKCPQKLDIIRQLQETERILSRGR